MKKLFSTSYSPAAFNTALFLLRVGAGILMIHHGYDKMVHFADYSPQFTNFLGLGGPVSLGLSIFAEFFCSIFIMLGLFTRLSSVALMINTFVAVWQGHKMDVLGKGEHASLFFLIYLTILIVGPGRYSVDGMVSK